MYLYSQFSGHTLWIEEIDRETMPKFEHTEGYKKFYVVKNWDSSGVIFFYLAKGNAHAPHQIVVWYKSGNFWSSYGTTFKKAIEGAQKDGWRYA